MIPLSTYKKNLKLKGLIIQSVAKDVNKLEVIYTADENAKLYNDFGKRLAVS